MYRLFLDKSMTYSCGIYPPTGEEGANLVDDEPKELELLEQSQINKLDEMIAKADIQSTDHVLEIGCGWGSFAMRAASTTGCKVTGITISSEQLALAQPVFFLEYWVFINISNKGNSLVNVFGILSMFLERYSVFFMAAYFQSHILFRC